MTVSSEQQAIGYMIMGGQKVVTEPVYEDNWVFDTYVQSTSPSAYDNVSDDFKYVKTNSMSKLN